MRIRNYRTLAGNLLRSLEFGVLLILTFVCTASAEGPVVSNVRASQRAGTRLVDIYYDVASASNRLTVAVSVSTNGGADYVLGSTNFVGAVGDGVSPGISRLVTWNAANEWNSVVSTNVRFRVLADDLAQHAGTEGMVLIPAGSFIMGNTIGDADISNAAPVSANISAFYMDANLVTWAQWQGVYSYATNHGYTFVNPGAGKGDLHPVQTVDWYDVVKWCNARSERDGRPPVYYTDPGLTVVYRSGEVAPYANWSAKGYRLPTEAEWEKAARGGLVGQRFPWGNLISQTNANYDGATATYAYDLGPNGYNPIGSIGGTSPATSPVGSFAPNGYGLYDMAGNLWQWCWDRYGTPYAGGPDPRGVSTGSDRVLRGGGWMNVALASRTAYRLIGCPGCRDSDAGFRCILPADPSTNGMVLIPGGAFTMGNTVGDSDIKNADPVQVHISALYMDTTVVTVSQWQEVLAYATNHGYVFVTSYSGRGASYPVDRVGWTDVVKWCNARSERAGLVPVYYSDPGLTQVYRRDGPGPFANWSVKGYRLPTEAEWEKAARGGLERKRFPWGDTISQSDASYYGSTASFGYDLGPNGYNPVGYLGGASPGISPVGSFTPNGYGLYDMAGNIWQWCWDWFGMPYAGGVDPRGPAEGFYRGLRGGSWSYLASNCRVGCRFSYDPIVNNIDYGFRTVLSPDPTTNGMVLIPGGSFTMGDTLDGMADATPVTNVNISAFYMDVNLVTWEQWQGVCGYATNHGYSFGNPGVKKGPAHPVQNVNWYDVVKWCNARSEQAGKVPVYYTDAGLTVVYRTGEVTPYANWSAKGYRLPTEAEWEKAARGGLVGQRFPWGNLISQTNANYYGSTVGDPYDLGPDGWNPLGLVGGAPNTSPVGSFPPNGYGLYDMAGNVWQWCWDLYGEPYSGGMDPRGVSSGSIRVFRGGGHNGSTFHCRTALRNGNDPAYRIDPAVWSFFIGFRTVFSPDPTTNGMVLIPGGSFTMGDTLDGDTDAKPVTNVFVSPFYMDVNLVTWSQWQGVYGYATNHGYTFVNPGAGKGAAHPVQMVDWYDVVKWCNARSEQAGKVPVYYADAGLTVVYRSGEVTPYANWSAKGYRLPTEAEWEKAARGGLAGQRFPWGNLISQTNANYIGATGSYTYDLGPNGYNPLGLVGGAPCTSPVGSFPPNGYGLYDMAGNVFQWCWDWYGTPYAGGTDPRGVSTASIRVIRSGYWSDGAGMCRSAQRGYYIPDLRGSIIGFRSVLSPDPSTNGMVLIPGGSFTMGDTLDGLGNATPVTNVYISPFYMDVNLVTWSQWQGVYGYATNHGYSLGSGAGKGAAHPVQSVNWYDVVKWCNARSEQAGKVPVYYTDAGLTVVYRTGEVTPYANWSAKGYRLPTEAEWEKAARGGLAGQRFPWGSLISQTNANYFGATGSYAYDLGPNGYNPIGSIGGTSPATSPVGSFAPNGYGLNDMAGNLWQWCWDWNGTPYAGGTDPRGVSTGSYRVIRGGSWPGDWYYNIGFRPVLAPGQ